MQAVILAGGLGAGLRPLMDSIPKVMVPARGRPFPDPPARMSGRASAIVIEAAGEVAVAKAN